MNAGEIKSSLDVLERKILVLLESKKNLKAMNDQLLIDKQKLKERIESRDETIESLKNQMKISKVVERMHSNGEDKESVKIIDEYICGIDKCIAFLQN